jgi:hypothetical protein
MSTQTTPTMGDVARTELLTLLDKTIENSVPGTASILRNDPQLLQSEQLLLELKVSNENILISHDKVNADPLLFNLIFRLMTVPAEKEVEVYTAILRQGTLEELSVDMRYALDPEGRVNYIQTFIIRLITAEKLNKTISLMASYRQQRQQGPAGNNQSINRIMYA